YPYFADKTSDYDSETLISDHICASSVILAGKTGAKAIAAMTSSGYTAFEISSHRPDADIFIFTGNRTLLITLSVVWGASRYYYYAYDSTDHMNHHVHESLVLKGPIRRGELVVNTASIPIEAKGNRNMVNVAVVYLPQTLLKELA